MKTISFPDGTPVPVLGQGTWKMGEGERDAGEEADALRLGIDLGMTLIDTAEMYGDGAAEVPLAETVEAFERLRAAGKIRAWGVSNLDVDDLEELGGGPGACATDQILYNPEYRGPEFDLLPWARARSMPVMAYSPVGQGGGLLRHRAVVEVARRHDATPAQVCLAWVLRQAGVLAIPKAGDAAHVRDNAAALDLALDAGDLRAIDAAFPAPTAKRPLALL